MLQFYEEQVRRLESMQQEPVLLADVLCQLHDMLQPRAPGAYSLADLKRTRPQSALLFNALFNLHKFLSFENRDPFALRAEALAEENGGAPLTEWDRFARVEYVRLAQEDDPDGGGTTAMAVDGGGGTWL
jgi:serine/threonine-protein phosphatase 2A regulatory subunit B''